MNISDRIGKLEQIAYDPSLMQRMAMNVLSEVTEGTIDIVDASNPFVFTLETSAVNTAYFLQHNKTLNRKQYPASAVDEDDLYLHMSDKDYIDRFAVPSHTRISLMIPKTELISSMIVDSSTGIGKLTIPRNSEFIIANTTFSLQYPIDIRQMRHGGIQITYDTDKLSPLQSLDSNIIDFESFRDPDGTEWINFSFLVYQFKINTVYNTVSSSAGFTTTIMYNDSYYYTRIYIADNNNQWNEIYTTHTDQVYDSTKPTAVLRVIGNLLSVEIPTVYTNTGLIKGRLRIDVYETKGDLNLVTSNYKIEDFSAKWLSIDNNEVNGYTTAINTIKSILIWSRDSTVGGRAELSLEALRTRVINNAIGANQIPITNIQLESSITDAGYDVVKNVDTITNRIFLATKEMPEPVDSDLITAAGSSMSRVMTRLTELNNAHGVIFNNDRYTITSDALYQNDNGIVTVVSNSNYQTFNNLTNAQKVDYLNNNNLLYSPFHYVVDINSSQFNSRPYMLDAPSIINKSFIDANTDSELRVNISSNFSITKLNDGYKLSIKVTSNQIFKDIPSNKLYCQLCYKAKDQYLYSYLLGVEEKIDPADNERIYSFKLDSTFDINENDQISQNAFRYSSSALSTYSDLTQVMDVLFICSDNSVLDLNGITSDSMVGRFQIPNACKVITHEQVKISFGKSLSSLWARTKSVSSPVNYKTYTNDVYATYIEDVYDIDPITGSIFSVGDDGKIVYNLIHNKGDVIKDASGNDVLLHPKGSVMIDNTGSPIPMGDLNDFITRFIDVMTIEASYKFATSASSLSYRNLIANTLVTWITEDIPMFNLSLLDQTKIYFYPKITQGDISCNVGNSVISNIQAAQSFNITLYVPKSTYNNSPLVTELNRITKSVIKDQLKNTTITISGIEETLKNTYGSDVTAVTMKGFEGDKYKAVIIVDKASKFSIKKRLVVLPNNDLIIEEDININYVLLEN